jgi:predicted SAM-dependent methyltransferase
MKLNIGCGKRNFGKEWIHIDGSNYGHIHSHDIMDLPFESNSVDLIYSSHTLEYFDRDEVVEVLRKWRSVLKPNGILRLAVPNFEMYSKLYSEGRITLEHCIGPLYGKWEMTGTQTVYHRTAYDFVSLKRILEEAGFENVRLWDWRAVEHGKHDDYSQSYIPHMDRNKGQLMSLNVECDNNM